MLRLLGWSVWWHGDPPSEANYEKALTQALRRSRCIIVLWSTESVESDWVRAEARTGLKRKVLIPARIDPIEPPKGFRSAGAVDLTNWDGSGSSPAFHELVSRLSTVLGFPPKGAFQGIALPHNPNPRTHAAHWPIAAYPGRWLIAGLAFVMLAGIGAWTKFHSVADVGTSELTRLSIAVQSSAKTSHLPTPAPAEEQGNESSMDGNNAQPQSGPDGESKPNDQASKEASEDLESRSRAARDEDPDRVAYEDARAAYRAGDYRGAIAAFEDVIKHSPRGPFASKSQYWVADCWFELHDYRAAAEARRTFIANYPDNPRLPDAMLGLAAAYIELGDIANARKTLTALIDRFPASQAAWRGHRQLVKLK